MNIFHTYLIILEKCVGTTVVAVTVETLKVEEPGVKTAVWKIDEPFIEASASSEVIFSFKSCKLFLGRLQLCILDSFLPRAKISHTRWHMLVKHTSGICIT